MKIIFITNFNTSMLSRCTIILLIQWMHNSHMIALCLSLTDMDAQPSVSEEHIHVKVGINNKNHEINYYIKRKYRTTVHLKNAALQIIRNNGTVFVQHEKYETSTQEMTNHLFSTKTWFFIQKSIYLIILSNMTNSKASFNQRIC